MEYSRPERSLWVGVPEPFSPTLLSRVDTAFAKARRLLLSNSCPGADAHLPVAGWAGELRVLPASTLGRHSTLGLHVHGGAV